jgi:hypothetical protein
MQTDNIKIDLKEMGYEVGDFIELARDVDFYEHRNDLLGSMKAGEFLD